MTKMNGTTMKASMKVETSLEAPKAHHECVVEEVEGAILEAVVASEARLEISREKMAIVSKSAAVKVAYPWEEVVVEVLHDVVINLRDVEEAGEVELEISPVVNSQVFIFISN